MADRIISRRALLGSTLASLAAAKPAARLPNIIWFMYDDLGSGGLGCYGQEKMRTPHSDRVACEGMRFTACYAGGSVCAPSRSVLMTGLHLGHAPVRANAQTVPLRPEDVTVAEVLKSAGYATGHFGKWGLGDAGSTGVPTRQGFDEFFGYLHQTQAHNYWPEYLRDGEEKHPLPANVGRRKGTYSAPLIASRAEQLLDKHAAVGRPFFLYTSPTLPHALFHPPNDEPYTDETAWSKRQRDYAAMVTDADAHLGRILALLDKHGVADNTIVFVTSDNGGPKEPDGDFFATNRGLRGYKGSLNEGGLRVPMLVRWPGRIAAGKVDPTPWYFADFLPTAAAIAGVKTPRGIDGMSMLPVLTGKAKRKRRVLYWEQSRWNAKTGLLEEDKTLAQAVRLGDWKAIRSAPGAPLALYDLPRDPMEERDVAAANPKVVAEIEAVLRAAHVAARPHNNGNPEWVGRKDIPPSED
ncbi:MAG: arylsulfatase [Acidobacteria bacterium]|nr:arylsulfatase [Acidobacteriota bacterium]